MHAYRHTSRRYSHLAFHFRLRSEDYKYYLEYTRARVAVIHESLLKNFEEAAADARYLHQALVVGSEHGRFLSFEQAINAQSDECTPTDTHRDDIAIWLFTSGSDLKIISIISNTRALVSQSSTNRCSRILRKQPQMHAICIRRSSLAVSTDVSFRSSRQSMLNRMNARLPTHIATI